MFNKDDFCNINYIEFDDDFNIELNQKSKIIFGYNGIGKSSIYKYLKNKYNEYDYLDYEDTKESFLKNKKEVVIGARIQTITKLKNEIEQLKQNNDVEGILKKYDYNSQAKAKKVSNELANIQKTKGIEQITLEKTKLDYVSNILYEEIKKDFFDNYKAIKEIANIKDEMELLKNVYMDQAYQALINSIDDHETTCPACNTKGIHNLKEIFNQKKKIYEECNKSLFGNFKFSNNIEKEKQIEKLIKLAKDFDGKEIAELIICDVNNERRSNIIENLKQIEEKNKEIEKMQEKLQKYYTNIKKEEKDIKLYFENRFDIEKLEFDDNENKIIVTFKRNVDTYSEGEIHLIILLFKLYEFKINDSDILIIDDPLTSYDLINQYKTLFEIVNTASAEKKILIFTHNIEMINIINSQDSGTFRYQYIEKYLNKLYLKNIDMNATGSILSLNNLLDLDSEKYLKLLIEREKEENDEYHKVFHYDNSYILQDSEFNGLTNEYFVNLIENFSPDDINNMTFSQNTFNKIIYMCAIRVWIEKKFYEAIKEDKETLRKITGKQFSEKVNVLLPRNSNSLLIHEYPNVTRTFLMSKKVMLNQNEHYQSQIIPFNYALNISLDELVNEINEIKERFNMKAEN
jgi:hypothetical protein